MFQPLEKKRYSEQIAHLIRQRILSQNLENGAKLPAERQLAVELGVSRSVVREALCMLDVSGYVSVEKRTWRRYLCRHRSITNRSVIPSRILRYTDGYTVDHLFDVRLQSNRLWLWKPRAMQRARTSKG